jgi:hypothetical protein
VQRTIRQRNSFQQDERTTAEEQTSKMAMPPLLKTVLAESADLLVGTVKMTILTAMLLLALILVGSFFSSGLPYRAIMWINGR